MAKEYPMKIENVGDDVYCLFSRGHHDVDAFMREVRKNYDWPLGMPEHIWMRAVPGDGPLGRCMLLHEAEANSRGAFPVTCVVEEFDQARQYETLQKAKQLAEAAARDAVLEYCAADAMPGEVVKYCSECVDGMICQPVDTECPDCGTPFDAEGLNDA